VCIKLAGPLWRTLWKTLTVIFFSRVLHNENHILHPLLPEWNDHGYELWRRWPTPWTWAILTSNDSNAILYTDSYI